MMVKVAIETERAVNQEQITGHQKNRRRNIFSFAKAVLLSEVKAIVTSTRSGYTACMVSRHKLSVTTYGMTNNPATARKLSLVWGIREVHLNREKEGISDGAFHAAKYLKSEGLQDSDLFIFTAGVSNSKKQRTNSIRIREIEKSYLLESA